MKKTFSLFGLLVALTLAPLATHAQTAADATAAVTNAVAAAAAAAPAKADPTLEQRILDLESYVNNGARGADAADAKISSKIAGSGPGHNGFQMVCAALVLFMTLPRSEERRVGKECA